MLTIETAKKIAKEHGVKGFRKLKLKRPAFVVGKQCAFMSKFIANNLIESLTKKGFNIQDKALCIELANKGLLDTLTIIKH